MSDVCVDAMGARFGQAFLAENAVLDHPEDEAPEMAQFQQILAGHGIAHEAGRQFLLRVWGTLAPHLIGGIPYDEAELTADLSAAAAQCFGQPLPDAVEIALRVGLGTDYGRGA